MPSKSPAQARLMAAAAHDPEFARKAGVPVSVAQEFNSADTGTLRLARALRADSAKRKRGVLPMKG